MARASASRTRSTGTVTCSDLEAESSAVFSTVIGVIVGGIYPDVILRVNFGAERRSLHPAAVAEWGDSRQIGARPSAVDPVTRIGEGCALPRQTACPRSSWSMTSARSA